MKLLSVLMIFAAVWIWNITQGDVPVSPEVDQQSHPAESFFDVTQRPPDLSSKALGNINAPKGGTFRVRMGGEPPTLNPIISDGHQAAFIQFHIIEPLMFQNIQNFNWDPVLATGYEVSKDGKSYEFELRKNARWNDGRPFTAEDVKFSFDVLFNDQYPTAHMRPYYERISRVEVINAHRVRFITKDNYFRNFISAAALPIVPKHIYQDPKVGSQIHDKLIGTGPYILEKWVRGRKITLRKNSAWWGNQDPLYRGKYNAERMVYQFVGDDSIALEMLKRGEIDFLPLNTETYIRAKEDRFWPAHAKIKKVKSLYPQSMKAIAWNTKNPILRDLQVRLALAMLMDRSAIASKFFFGLAEPATGPWYKQSEFADPNVQPILYNSAQALDILRNAGWSDTDHDQVLDKIIDGKKYDFKITILTDNAEMERVLTFFREDARLAGVRIQVRFLGWNALMQLIDEKKFDGVTTQWGGGVVDFDPKPNWHSSSAFRGGFNITGYNNPLVDQLIDKARSTPELEKRRPLMQKIYKTIAEDIPYLFMLNDSFILYAHNVRMSMPQPTFRYDVGIDYWWIEDGP